MDVFPNIKCCSSSKEYCLFPISDAWDLFFCGQNTSWLTHLWIVLADYHSYFPHGALIVVIGILYWLWKKSRILEMKIFRVVKGPIAYCFVLNWASVELELHFLLDKSNNSFVAKIIKGNKDHQWSCRKVRNAASSGPFYTELLNSPLRFPFGTILTPLFSY